MGSAFRGRGGDAEWHIDAFTCEHPSCTAASSRRSEERAESSEVTAADIAGALREEHDELLGPGGSFSSRTDDGELELPLQELLVHAAGALHPDSGVWLQSVSATLAALDGCSQPRGRRAAPAHLLCSPYRSDSGGAR